MDHELYVRLVLAGCVCLKCDEVWARFRWHASSKTRQQWVNFNRELLQIVERTFRLPTPGVQAGWRREALANAWQWLGEAYLYDGQRRAAGMALLRAIGLHPLRAKTVMAVALLADVAFGTKLSAQVRRWRYRLPDAPMGAQPFDDVNATQLR
jgi:hypothetical protein